jgi:1,4-dihydroxy-2-naphthoate octaprenyltransferase
MFLRGIIFAMSESPFSQLQIWLLAIRPKTLPAAAAPVIVGTALAYLDDLINWKAAMVCLLAALLLQIGSNLANDVFDYEKGADQGERFGPTRVTQSGMLTPGAVKRGMLVVFGLSIVLGIYLIVVGGWPILVIGLAAIISAIIYTGGPFPLGYHGLGDLFVFVFFGLVAVTGTYYVQALRVDFKVWWMATAMGLLTVAILVVNNLRDIDSDGKANKRTLAVRFGKTFARLEYMFCLLGAYIVPVALWGVGELPFFSLLILFTIPVGVRLVLAVYRDVGKVLNKTLAGTGQLELLYAMCFALGIMIDSLIR